MKLAAQCIKSYRCFSAVAKKETVSSQNLSSEFFDHIRHQVYGDAKALDKIVVDIIKDEDTKIPVLINRNVSTGADCLNHVSKHFAEEAALIEVIPSVGSSYFSSVNQPIQDKSEVKKIGFESLEHADLINDIYWRSCSLLTGSILKDALSFDIFVKNNENTVHDNFFSVDVSRLTDGAFSSDEIHAINRFARSFLTKNIPLETLHVPTTIAEENGVSDTHLVRIGSNVFTTSGPVINSTQQVGRFTLFQMNPSSTTVTIGGVSLPSFQPTSSYSWGLIVKNAIQKAQRK